MRERSTKDSSFPYWVALGSLVFVLALFFTNTVPALEERKSLTALRHDLVDLRDQYEEAIDSAAQLAHLGKGPNGNFDLQSLLVAIDQHGYTPRELHAIYQQMAKQPSEPGDRDGGEDREPR